MIKPKEFELFKKIASGYEGNIVEKDDEISITSVNKIAGYNSPTDTEYTISVRKYDDNGITRVYLSGHEKGHWSGFTETFTEHDLERNLKQKGFIKKAQLSIFDLL